MGRDAILVAILYVIFTNAAYAADISASPPRDLSVTVYRNPERNGGAIDLNNLGGFALVTETRTVHLPIGETRLRFEGVVDGIMPESAIVSGLPGGVLEKNRDRALLSPEALIRASRGATITLRRTNTKTGKVVRTPAVIKSANQDGIVFETPDGIEALQCSGLSETFTYAQVPKGVSALPTLSVLTRSPREITATVKLSYLTSGFDWSAAYVATVAPDGRTLDLGAWVTLANGNSISLREASTQVVAGKLNREPQNNVQADNDNQVIAQCWPRGSTSDKVPTSEIMLRANNGNLSSRMMRKGMVADFASAAAAVVVTAQRVSQEQLGDLKLYRVPEVTTVAAQQLKQVRLLDQTHVPFQRIYGADVAAIDQTIDSLPATLILRSKNDLAHKLGLPLPSGRVSVFETAFDRPMWLGETSVKDNAVDEVLEFRMGETPNVRYTHTIINHISNAPKLVRLTPRLRLALRQGKTMEIVEITNARNAPVAFELRLQLQAGTRVAYADQPLGKKDGRPIFRLNVPANGKTQVHYTVVQ